MRHRHPVYGVLFVCLLETVVSNWSNFSANHDNKKNGESWIYAIRGNSKETQRGTGRARGAKQTPEFGCFSLQSED
jgi:hypothetical protein